MTLHVSVSSDDYYKLLREYLHSEYSMSVREREGVDFTRLPSESATSTTGNACASSSIHFTSTANRDPLI